MIDLEKEEKAFKAYMNLDECDEDDISIAECNGWVARAIFENEEIEKLKAKLAKYESDDVVVMPRKINHGMCDAMNNFLRGCCGGVCIYEEEAWEEMIEAGEIK